MALPGTPKAFAHDIADGYFSFTGATCRQFAPEDLRSLHRVLERVAREIRAEQVPLELVAEIQRKNLRLTRVRNVLMLIRYHAKRHRFVL